ncbi:MAG: nitronate monooxygenase [Longimicrobiales bacterium]|nr:nitronate monooxygenase [Longimicrobiales bacterium]
MSGSDGFDVFDLPSVIQGGMGVAVSSWPLARAVSMAGGLGVVSGTALDTVLVRRLQEGDFGGDVRRAMAHFPLPDVVEEVLERFFRPEGKAPDEPFEILPLYRRVVSMGRERLIMLANFVEVFLAREGHDGPIGINLMTKIQIPNLASLYGAMLAGVDAVLMGAGIPREIPGALDRLAAHERATHRLVVEGDGEGESAELSFDPRAHFADPVEGLRRPAFLAIVSTDSLATILGRKASGHVDGFVVEAPSAGGHNAPPRDRSSRTASGEPLYGPRDYADLERIRGLDRPFWVAGGAGSPEGLREAQAAGAAGVQVGTLFAFCEESGIDDDIRRSVLEDVREEHVHVFTDSAASPTGFPFKVVEVEGTLSDGEVHADRERICDLGYLRTAYRRPDGRIGFRCPAEPVETWVKKGGAREETEGRKCVCNGLLATVGLGQARGEGKAEPPIVTAGDDLVALGAFLSGRTSYSAADVMRYLVSESLQEEKKAE